MRPSWLKKGGRFGARAASAASSTTATVFPGRSGRNREATAKTEARKHFDQGLALFDAGSLATALPEFLLSSIDLPHASATKNAALASAASVASTRRSR